MLNRPRIGSKEWIKQESAPLPCGCLGVCTDQRPGHPSTAPCRCEAPLPTYVHEGHLHMERRCLICGHLLPRRKADKWFLLALVVYVLGAAIALAVLAWKVCNVR